MDQDSIDHTEDDPSRSPRSAPPANADGEAEDRRRSRVPQTAPETKPPSPHGPNGEPSKRDDPSHRAQQEIQEADKGQEATDGRAFRAYAAGFLETGTVRSGRPLPLGVELRDGGANFAVFSRHATQVWIEFYEDASDAEPQELIGLDPEANRTGDIWHVWVQGIRPGQLYGYRVDGPYDPEQGHRFNPHKLLIDPYATAITHLDTWDFKQARGYDPQAADLDLSFSTVNNAQVTPKCVITQTHFDWEGVTPPKRGWADTVIYEMHVRGYTRDESAGVDHPGTFRGVIEKIPYLQDLGVTAVELMPVQEFNEFEVDHPNPLTGEELRNFWGYNPTAFMAPSGHFAADGRHGQQVIEFKQMVKELHRAGIEVFLDVVFNHTAEGHELGPTFSWRGFDNSIYYMLESDRRYFRDYTGTGNTVKADHPVVRDLILDALRYWVLEMHVDGFRFDLASVLGRDQNGDLLAEAPLIERIAEDPILRDIKIIAEAWDAAGAYQVGSFYATSRWAEWNGRFRDDVRRFWRGDAGQRGAFATRLSGSADLYETAGRGPLTSVNYITSHDGFTLNDLVSYRWKHNLPNGENNRDGQNANYSANYGVEGPTDDPGISRIRERQVRNFLLTLFVSRGVPMMLGGDEFRRTQKGNNNAYCQDNEISWVDWAKREEYAGLTRFVRQLIRFRRQVAPFTRNEYYTDAEVEWLDCRSRTPDWDDPDGRCLTMMIPSMEEGDPDILLVFNAGANGREFTLPPTPSGGEWYRKVDTSLPSPEDILTAGGEVHLEDQSVYSLDPHSSAVLIAPQPE
jgi:glycogen operon protein